MDQFQKFGLWIIISAIVTFIIAATLWGLWSGEPETYKENLNMERLNTEPMSVLKNRCTDAFCELQAGIRLSLATLLNIRAHCTGYQADALDAEIKHLQAVLAEKDRLMEGLYFDEVIQPRLFVA